MDQNNSEYRHFLRSDKDIFGEFMKKYKLALQKFGYKQKFRY